jgi:23S rRNA (uracil1939-C5)-methyltransferase
MAVREVTQLRKPRRDDLLEVELDALDERGLCVGRAEDASGAYRVTLRGALPGERVLAKVLRRRGERIEALMLERLTPSAQRVEPRCRHFGTCGGCSFQDLDYTAQLGEKLRTAERTLHAAGIDVQPDAVIGCDEPWSYRNKMDFTFGSRRWVEMSEPADAPRDFALGLHPREQFRRVLDVARCEIQFEQGNAILASVRRSARELGLSPWDLETHTGLLRHVVLRHSRASGEILLDLVTSQDAPELVRPLVEALLAAHPQITTLVQNVNTRVASIAVGEREIVWHGSGTIVERLAGLEFAVSANSFFQTNTAQAEKLVALVLAEAGARADDVVFDVYCGTGTFTLPLARVAREVHGFELVEAAVADARRNAERNGIANARFVAGDVVSTLTGPDLPAPDLLVIDPPRAGCHPKVIERIAALGARRLLYVSCNLRAAAHDVAALRASNWRLVRVRPIDLFPHTPHLESLLTLERVS